MTATRSPARPAPLLQNAAVAGPRGSSQRTTLRRRASRNQARRHFRKRNQSCGRHLNLFRHCARIFLMTKLFPTGCGKFAVSLVDSWPGLSKIRGVYENIGPVTASLLAAHPFLRYPKPSAVFQAGIASCSKAIPSPTAARGRNQDPNHPRPQLLRFWSRQNSARCIRAESGVFNRGISGNKIPDLAGRWQRTRLSSSRPS